VARIEIRRNEIPDGDLARRVEAEIVDAAASADAADAPLGCEILDEGLHAEIEIELPGWTERVTLTYPVRPGDVRSAVHALLRDLGLAREPASFRVADFARGW
jgi:hypothetical protein